MTTLQIARHAAPGEPSVSCSSILAAPSAGHKSTGIIHDLSFTHNHNSTSCSDVHVYKHIMPYNRHLVRMNVTTSLVKPHVCARQSPCVTRVSRHLHAHCHCLVASTALQHSIAGLTKRHPGLSPWGSGQNGLSMGSHEKGLTKREPLHGARTVRKRLQGRPANASSFLLESNIAKF